MDMDEKVEEEIKMLKKCLLLLQFSDVSTIIITFILHITAVMINRKESSYTDNYVVAICLIVSFSIVSFTFASFARYELKKKKRLNGCWLSFCLLICILLFYGLVPTLLTFYSNLKHIKEEQELFCLVLWKHIKEEEQFCSVLFLKIFATIFSTILICKMLIFIILLDITNRWRNLIRSRNLNNENLNNESRIGTIHIYFENNEDELPRTNEYELPLPRYKDLINENEKPPKYHEAILLETISTIPQPPEDVDVDHQNQES